MPQFLKCTINEQDGMTENESELLLELPDNTSEDAMEAMFRAFLLEWYSDGDWEDEEAGIAWFPTVGMSVSYDVDRVETKAEFDVLVKYSSNATQKFLPYLMK